ncbi:MAG: diadenylate cyclase CdaA [Clostridia bacterium]|nr:diadenylate cyclase CdaA [Clostridia bacterium]
MNWFDTLATAFSEHVIAPLRAISVIDVIDILIIAYIFYVIYMQFRERRAGNMLVGLVILTALYFVSRAAQLNAVHTFLDSFYQVGAVVILIVFQNDLCDLLDRLGAKTQRLRNIAKRRPHDIANVTATIALLSDSAVELSHERTGALIVVERSSKLGEYIKNGVMIDGELSVELICNLFYNHSPLHDGAVIIREGKIAAAGCILPSSKNTALPKELGTRHRAAVGISEQSDAVVIVVSEETGGISIANNGVLKRGYTSGTLRDDLFLLLAGETRKEEKEKTRAK